MVETLLAVAGGGLFLGGIAKGYKPLMWAGVAVLLVSYFFAPDSGCFTDWDGRSNPTVCD